ncbi:uncharacterized protein [Hoplias malabaricus]|uniref:uncharacterized protein n=1 Tax=Hoplias malabaricus TaxID=27720 RepID=UPI00346264DA
MAFLLRFCFRGDTSDTDSPELDTLNNNEEKNKVRNRIKKKRMIKWWKKEHCREEKNGVISESLQAAAGELEVECVSLTSETPECSGHKVITEDVIAKTESTSQKGHRPQALEVTLQPETEDMTIKGFLDIYLELEDTVNKAWGLMRRRAVSKARSKAKHHLIRTMVSKLMGAQELGGACLSFKRIEIETMVAEDHLNTHLDQTEGSLDTALAGNESETGMAESEAEAILGHQDTDQGQGDELKEGETLNTSSTGAQADTIQEVLDTLLLDVEVQSLAGHNLKLESAPAETEVSEEHLHFIDTEPSTSRLDEDLARPEQSEVSNNDQPLDEKYEMADGPTPGHNKKKKKKRKGTRVNYPEETRECTLGQQESKEATALPSEVTPPQVNPPQKPCRLHRRPRWRPHLPTIKEERFPNPALPSPSLHLTVGPSASTKRDRKFTATPLGTGPKAQGLVGVYLTEDVKHLQDVSMEKMSLSPACLQAWINLFL